MPSDFEQFASGFLRSGTQAYMTRKGEQRKQKRQDQISQWFLTSQDPNLPPEVRRMASANIFGETGQQVRNVKTEQPKSAIINRTPAEQNVVDGLVNMMKLDKDDPLMIALPTMKAEEIANYAINDPRYAVNLSTLSDPEWNFLGKQVGIPGEMVKARYELSIKSGATPNMAFQFATQKDKQGTDKTQNLNKALGIIKGKTYEDLLPEDFVTLKSLGFTPGNIKSSYKISDKDTPPDMMMRLKQRLADRIIDNAFKDKDKKYKAAALEALGTGETPEPSDFNYILYEALEQAINLKEYNELPPEQEKQVNKIKDMARKNKWPRSELKKYLKDWASKGVISYELIPIYMGKIYAE